MDQDEIKQWFLDSDVSIQYQVHRDLLDSDKEDLRERIAQEGWGAAFLSRRKQEGHWGKSFYQPKWISSHYTILDLKNLAVSPDIQEIKESIALIIKNHKEADGGINPGKTIKDSDICVNGMFLNYASYFGIDEAELKSVVDLLLREHMEDGGFNCQSNRDGASHSSMHTTVSVLEGIWEYAENGYSYRLDELEEAAAQSREFLLKHRLYRSDRTGEVIDKRWLMLSYPSRWRYDILRALDYFRSAGLDYDDRMADAVQVLRNKQRADGRWPVQANHPGKTHFDMEQTGKPSRWNTLRALRVLNHFKIEA